MMKKYTCGLAIYIELPPRTSNFAPRARSTSADDDRLFAAELKTLIGSAGLGDHLLAEADVRTHRRSAFGKLRLLSTHRPREILNPCKSRIVVCKIQKGSAGQSTARAETSSCLLGPEIDPAPYAIAEKFVAIKISPAHSAFVLSLSAHIHRPLRRLHDGQSRPESMMSQVALRRWSRLLSL